MAEDQKVTTLLGISLASEAHIQDVSYDDSLGMASVNDITKSLADFRTILLLQVDALPESYSFLTREGWQIGKVQEDSVTVKQILRENNLVRVYRSFDKPRVGIKTKLDGQAVGFVFIGLKSSITDLRSAITNQIGYSNNGGCYKFVDRNGWPIRVDQESRLTVTDILHKSTVIIEPSFLVEREDSVDYPDSAIEQSHKRPRLDLKQLTYTSSKDLQRLISQEELESFQPKQILISYVRSEAAQNAINLKLKLTEQGCTSVFLDVHEIKSGVDWADSLNFAVCNCEVFIPLVTPHYGETQWTNREVKLADMLSKFIVPISFIDHWPPKCLAIQFATTQFIPWSSTAVIKWDDTSSLISNSVAAKIWTADQLDEVTCKIMDRVNNYQSGAVVSPKLCRKLSKLRSCPRALPEEFSVLSKPREGRPLVVISLHPQQSKFGATLKQYLESEDFEVWLSTDLLSGCSFDTNSDDELLSQEDLCGSTLKLDSESDICLSQLSQLSMSPEGACDAKKKEYRRLFQQKVDEAGVVIFVLSKAYAKSRTCSMQVFYCEHRKRVIAMKYEDFCMPTWLSVLIGTGVFESHIQDFKKDRRRCNYEASLLNRIKKTLDKDGYDSDHDEQSVNNQVKNLKTKLPKGIYVYISGGTKFYHKQSKEICRVVGKHLAEIEGISIVTGGFYGVGELVSRAYHEERTRLKQKCHLWHILPMHSNEDVSCQAKQLADGSFAPAEYGDSLFAGNSVREREVIVSRVFDMCLLIEGGPGAAHEAEQFSWSGHTVIPVQVTGGAASGKFKVPEKVFCIPVGASERDWSILSDKSATVSQMAESVFNIVSCEKLRLQMDSPAYINKLPRILKERAASAEDIFAQGDGEEQSRKRKSASFDVS